MESKNQKVVVAVLLIVTLGLAGSTYFFYKKYVAIQKNPQQYVQQTVDQLVSQVGKLMLLPTGEAPTIATVVDPAKLKDQPFFLHAKAGDKVLIYTNARKAILFSVTDNKIVEVAPLTIGNPATPATAPAPVRTTAPEQPASSTTGNQ